MIRKEYCRKSFTFAIMNLIFFKIITIGYLFFESDVSPPGSSVIVMQGFTGIFR